MKPYNNIRTHFPGENRDNYFKKTFLGKALTGFFLIGFVLNPVLVSAKPDTDSKIIEGFKNWYGSVNSLKADFRQSTFNPVWGQEQKATGEVFFMKPGQMRWEYRSPQKDVIIINQEGLFWYVPEDNQVIKKKKEDAFQTISPMSILGENIELEKDFDVLGIDETVMQEKGGDEKGAGILGYTMVLKPKRPQAAVKKINLKVKAGEFSLDAIEVEEQSGGYNKIEFNNLCVNPDLKPDFFIFTPPHPGIKVITPNDFPLW